MIKMVYAVMLSAGIILFAFAMIKLRKTFSLMRNGYSTEATVISLIPSRSAKGRISYAPVYQFTTVDQRTITYQDPISSSPAIRKIDERVKLYYDPGNPEDLMIASYWGLFRWTIVLLAIAMPFLVVGGGYFMALRYLS